PLWHVDPRPRRLDTRHCARIVQRSKGNQVLDFLKHLVIDDGRVREIRSAVNHSMPDRTEPNSIKINTTHSKIFCHRPHGGGMISNRAAGLTDPLNNALSLHLGSLRNDKLILQRRGTSVEDKNRSFAHQGLPAPAAASEGCSCL